MTIDERYFPGLVHPAWIAFTSAGFLIAVIACANVANLMLSRSLQRARELAIRSSLGAGRLRLIRQLLVESTVLAALGGLVGLGLGVLAVRVYAASVPSGLLGYWVHYSLDGRILAMLVLVSMATVFVFGLVPALYASKTDVITVLKDGGRAGRGTRSLRRWTTAFMTAELAVTVVLLANNSMNAGRGATLPSDEAIDATDVLTASIALPAARYATPESRAAFHAALQERIAALPGVSAASLATQLPMNGGGARDVAIEGDRYAEDEKGPSAWTVAVSPGFFDTLTLAPSRGRDLTNRDGAGGETNVVVNERFAERFLAGREPIGTRIALRIPGAAAPAPDWRTIVGVTPTIRREAGVSTDPMVYEPIRQSAPAVISLLVRSGTDMAALTASVREAVLGLDANLPVFRAMTLRQSVREASWGLRVSTALVMLLTILAVVLSTVGLYAITAQAVSQRTPEIGLRMALGARGGHVSRLVLRPAAVQLALGFAAGVAGTFFWDRTFVPAEVATRLVDPATLATVGAALAIVMALACVVPARRAARLDPVAALREQ
jgi:putative ABC transport system permease protein